MKKILSVFILFTCLAACKKEDGDESATPQSDVGSVTLAVSYKIDSQDLFFDSMCYLNEGGNPYELTGLMYYLSDFTFFRSDGSNYKSDHIQYIDARREVTNEFSINQIPNGVYTSVKFNIGIDSARNIPGGLPAISDNLNMEWPVSMGGGYHFLRLEGYYADSTATPGFAMHMGRNECLVQINYEKSLSIQSNTVSWNLIMNINEWFKNPHTWNFNTDGNYTMGNTTAMIKLAENGKDVFKP